MTVGIVGAGAFGVFIAKVLGVHAPSIEVKIFSRRQVPDQETYFLLEEVASCDFVVLAVPIRAFRETLERVIPLLGKESVVVDVATVKKYTSDVLRELLPEGRYIATHPMFGPESYVKQGGNLKGCTFVITETTLREDELDRYVTCGEQLGLTMQRLSSDEHDKLLAKTLFFTHLVAQIAVGAGIARTPIDTVSFGSLMDAVESVRNDTELFRDVHRFNPFAKSMLDAFHASAQKVVEGLHK